MLRNLKTIKRQCGSTYNVAPGFSKRLNAEEYLNLLYLNVATADESFRIFAKLYRTINLHVLDSIGRKAIPHTIRKYKKMVGQNTFQILVLNDANMIGEH